jgi:APA family basic amino acid/polyamine antiporter
MPAGLRREIGRADLIGLTINSTVGAGILGLPGKLFALTGSWDILLCLAGGFLMALIISCFAEAGSRFSSTGGVYLYVREAFGPRAGIVGGWLSLIGRLLAYGAIANLAIIYITPIMPVIGIRSGRMMFITILTGAMTIPVCRGVRISALTHNLFSLVKMSVLIGFCACAVPGLLRHGIPASPFPPAANWGAGLILLFFALAGAEAVVVSNGEMRDPARDLPVALFAGTLAVVAASAIVPDLAHSTRPVFDGAVQVFGPKAGIIVIIGGVIAMSGVMFVTLFSSPRAVFAMAQAGQLPRFLALVDARTGAPHAAIMVSTLIAWSIAVGYGFFGALAASALVRLVLYAVVAVASLRLRRLGFAETGAPLALPFARTRVVAVVLLSAAIIAQAPWSELLAVTGTVLIGVLLAAVWGRQKSWGR